MSVQNYKSFSFTIFETAKIFHAAACSHGCNVRKPPVPNKSVYPPQSHNKI